MSEMEEIKAQLEARLVELGERAEDIDEELAKPEDDDWSEAAVESEGDEVLEQVGNLALAEIQRTKLALRKIRAGTYGKCERCSKKIAPKRLVAMPHATTCIGCA